MKKAQRTLITWLAEEPRLYERVKKYITAQDFTLELYRRVAEKMFRELETGSFEPAGVISMFEDEEQQREAALLFHTRLPRLETGQEREKAFRDVLLCVKKNSYENNIARMGADVNALSAAIQGKKELEALAKTHISLD